MSNGIYDYVDDVKERLVEKDKRIAELEEQLKNAIVPKFKVGDKAYAIIDTTFYTGVFPVDIVGIMLGYKVYDGQHTTNQNYVRVFATEEEAQAKLKELQGEK